MYFYETDPAVLTLNSTVVYKTQDDQDYTYSSPFGNITQSLFLRMKSFSGYGVFEVDYCDGLIVGRFQTVNAENSEMVISL